ASASPEPASPEPPPPAETAVPTPTPAAAAAGSIPDRGPQSQILSPLVRRLAAEHDLDLSLISGTGTGGRITKNDVTAAISSGSAAAGAGAAQPAVEHPSIAPAPSTAPQASVAPSVTPQPSGEEIVPMTHIRKAIAQHMHQSLQVSARAWNM